MRPSDAVAGIATLKRPLGRPGRATGAEVRGRLTGLTRFPRTFTTALMNVMPGSLRIRMVNLRRLTHAFADGSENALAAEIAFGLGLVLGAVARNGAGLPALAFPPIGMLAGAYPLPQQTSV